MEVIIHVLACEQHSPFLCLIPGGHDSIENAQTLDVFSSQKEDDGHDDNEKDGTACCGTTDDGSPLVRI